MDFVWIYANQFSHFAQCGLFNELEYSIKTVLKFYPGARCWVVGDEPSTNTWNPYKYIYRHLHSELVQTGKSGLHRENIDIMRKLKIVLDSEVGEEFVLMYDDQFFLQPITYDDFRPTALCRIEDVAIYPRKFGLLYGSLWRDTYKEIATMTDEVYDWETHLPRLMNKEKTRFVIDMYDMENRNLLIHSIYYTLYAETVTLLDEHPEIRSHTWTIGRNMDYDDIFSKKFLILHDDSIVPDMWNRIKSLVE